jgi:HAD superfamily hydrolase (TIGR01509 family)
MAYKAIIFDCDGTLVDSERLANEELIEYLAAAGVQLTMQESAARFNGVEMKDSVAQIEQLLGGPVPADFVQTMRARLERALTERLQPTRGVQELVASLQVPYCIASNAPPEKIELSLRVTGLLRYFQGSIHSAYTVGSWKPDPTLFLHAAAGMAVAPGQCVVVEDSVAGVRAGVAAGMTVFAYQPQQLDSRLPPQARVFTDFEELGAEFRAAGLMP